MDLCVVNLLQTVKNTHIFRHIIYDDGRELNRLNQLHVRFFFSSSKCVDFVAVSDDGAYLH